MKKVGIIGNGFVGESMAFAFSPMAKVHIYDIDPLRSTHSLTEVLSQEFIFVCLPTPMKKDGNQDLSYIDDFFKNNKSDGIFIIKSTVLPGTTKSLAEKYNQKIIFSPEFLTERTAKLDVLTQSRIILGGDEKLTKKVEELFVERFSNKTIIHTDETTAEFIKYMNNTFFATKVSIMNEFYRLAKKINVDWEKSLYGFLSDGRIADSHTQVPGPDGNFGYGGTCFPKDVNAFIKFAESYKVNLNTIEAGWKTNLEVRQEKDWEKKKGRAVSE
jgi:nucleotide sugar dehydrogenase